MKAQNKRNPVNLTMLRRFVRLSDLKKRAICERLQITYPTLQRKLDGDAEISLWEAVRLSELLKLTKAERDAIFFGDVC